MRRLTVCSLAILLTGCAALWKPTVDDQRARFLLNQLEVQNLDLKQFKGLAKVKLASAGQSHTGRMAYAAVRPDKMRVELLSTLGTPLTSLAGDGEHISIRSHVNDKRYRVRQTRKALRQVIDLPLGLEELQELLSGRVPLPPHAYAVIKDTADPQEVIVLKSRWRDLVAELRMDNQTYHIDSLKAYDTEGAMTYLVQWHQWKKIKGFMLPSKVTIESEAHQRLILWIDRFWPNPEIAPSVFVLDFSRPKS